MNKAKEFYKTMWNPLYEDTDHPQFSYKELIEFAEEYKQHCSQAQNLPISGVSDWVAVSEELPEAGAGVWAVTYNDDKVKKIVWGTGDEAFYEYWKVLNRPEPPCRTKQKNTQ